MLTTTTTTTSNNLSLTSLNDSLNLKEGDKQQQHSLEFKQEQEECFQYFDRWSPIEQIDFVENILRRMCHFQHGHINSFLKPMLQRDFISSLPG